MTVWTIEYQGDRFERFLLSLHHYEQAVLLAAIEHVLKALGPDICAGEWGRPLGGGLYEFRIRKSLQSILNSAGVDAIGNVPKGGPVLIRVFCTFHGDKIVLLYHGYNKAADPSPRRQQREIRRARKLHDQWQRQRGWQ